MGFNTVAFLLNDQMSCIERSPKSAAWLLSHPPMCFRDSNEPRHWMIKDFGEPYLPEQALFIFPTFHADDRKFYMAGRNDMNELKIVKYQTVKGRKYVLLELPEHLQDKK